MARKKGGLLSRIKSRMKTEIEGINEIIWEIKGKSRRRPSIGGYVQDRWKKLREGIHD
jgi:hypothetical protein